MSGVVRCGCCGVRAQNPDGHKTVPVCSFCAQLCNGVHGDALQHSVMAHVSTGRMEPFHAIAVMMLDDAWITRSIAFRPAPGGVLISVIAPPRWRVVVARAQALGTMPAIGDVCEAVLVRYFGGPNVQRIRDEIRREMIEALTAIDPDIVDIEIKIDAVTLGPNEIKLMISKRTNIEPGAMVMPAIADVAIPDDIMLRSRGKA